MLNFQNNDYCLKLKRWKQKESLLAIFYYCVYSLSQLFNDINEIKTSKVYVPNLYAQIKDKNVTFYIKTKKGDMLTSYYQKELFTFKYVYK